MDIQGITPNGITPKGSTPQLVELEAENARLHRLVADLLVKNQQLRVELKAAHWVPAFAGLSKN